MRILHCIPSLGGGGAERQLSYIGAEMAALGIMTDVAYIHDGPNGERLLRSGARLHRIRCRGNHDPGILLSLWRLVVTQRPDLIQTWLPQMDIAGSVIARLAKRPFVLTERSCESAYGVTWKYATRRRLGMYAAAIAANSEGGRRYWERLRYPGLLEVVRNGLPLDEIAATLPAVPPWDVGPGSPIVVYAGRFSEEKNVRTVALAFMELVERHRGVVALMFGDGPLKADIQRLCRQSPCYPDRLRIVGYADNLWSWFRRATLFVSLSRFEGNPNAVLEAAACGCPQIVSDIPAHREILDDESAWLVADVAPRAIAGLIIELLSRPDLRAQRCANAQARVSRWSISAAAQHYLGLYRKILGATSRSVADEA